MHHQKNHQKWVLVIWLMGTAIFSLATETCAEDNYPPSGESTIRAPLLDSEIVITTTNRLAGAIHSVRWRGQEFIDSADHGRQLQSASNFDAGFQQMIPETFNPTEAGSVADGAGPASTSRLLHLIAEKNRLQTTTQMAFWLPPDGYSLGNPARNTTPLSHHLLTKRVQIGYRNLPQVIVYDVTFHLPVNEQHYYAQFEILTGYMPPIFSRFLVYDPEQDQLLPLTEGPGEQKLPVILATADSRFAMGCYTPWQPENESWQGPGYGRFAFEKAKVMKWNCVARYLNQAGVEAKDYSFRVFVVIGDLELVQKGIRELSSREGG